MKNVTELTPNENPFSIIKKIIFDNMKEVMPKLILIYYHYYQSDCDSFRAIYNSVLDFYILNESDVNKLYDEVVKSLQNEYFYDFKEGKPLKLKSHI